jgi:hypothetical protein
MYKMVNSRPELPNLITAAQNTEASRLLRPYRYRIFGPQYPDVTDITPEEDGMHTCCAPQSGKANLKYAVADEMM